MTGPRQRSLTQDKKGGALMRLRTSAFGMGLFGLLCGILIWGGLNMGMEWTNRTEFCISCHEMRIPYEELRQSSHFRNRSGSPISCSDCHVASSKTPLDYARKLTMKVFAAKDVAGHLLGTIDSPEKFEAHRFDMAQRVWASMKETDSKECRNCHAFDRMDPAKQKDRSAVKHEGAVEDQKTCIDCHKGIVHKPVHQRLESAAAGPTTTARP
ncbi:MAG TPA: NapC/NirT family cytochrome c [Burkholderiaceae bacterium]|nr:NapC/NirT family cytochrome c [Burkholderiaceae bacterium]HMY98844.1 NapC/NirT family cytochrome c [Burkholderiaceae bacterium]HNB42955.1 NapC/NirT family cytochrome c [Burkholderiaceae bacterium]